MIPVLCRLLALAAVALPAPDISFEAAIRPILVRRCVSCHGAGAPQAGLDLRTLGDILQGGRSGPAVKPGDPGHSALLTLVKAGKMPPAGPKLSVDEIQKIESWIKVGAPGDRRTGFWAFVPPKRLAIPAVRDRNRVRNPIDSFLLAALEAKRLGFSPEADKRTLIRRVTYDLIGLPPTPAEIDAFVGDGADAYERLVDRLLANPRYGERMARHWLDAAGYADSEGILQEDTIRPNAWRYRDYVIRSMNSDKPYDRFLMEQIAGDELVNFRTVARFTPEIEEALVATGFLRTAVDATRPDFNPHQFTEYQYRMLNDTQTIVSSAVMGITLQCARCHDHKYEPLSQSDYYRVQAIFAGAIRPEGPLLPSRVRQIVEGGKEEQGHAKDVNAAVDLALKEIETRDQEALESARLKILSACSEIPAEARQSLLVAVKTAEANRTAEQKTLIEKYKTIDLSPDSVAKKDTGYAEQCTALKNQRDKETKKRITLAEIRAIYDQDATPPPTRILVRGDWTRPGDAVEPGVPSVLGAVLPFRIPPAKDLAGSTGRRLAFAKWLTQPENPLTARVIVNRIWASHFGVGIVPSVANFGSSGDAPSNHALLDWLATDLAQNRWSLKSLHRLIVTSSAYRQSSAFRADADRVDPDDRLIWRQRTRRLEAEAMRDGMLAVSGTLDVTMFGQPVAEDTRPTGEIVATGEANGGRRSIYLLVRRSMPVSILNAFDMPVMETNCTRRTPSATATQALALLNGTFVTGQAIRFARRILKEVTADSSWPVNPGRVDLAYRLSFGRAPTASESGATMDFLTGQILRFRNASKAEALAVESAYADLCHALLSANEFLYVD